MSLIALTLTASNTNVSLSTIPTSTLGVNYYALKCQTSCTYCNSNAFKVSIINCVAPSFNYAVLKPSF
jgi:hypothetical protein